MRDWLTAFRPASFRGVGFQVEFENAEGGRRLAVSPIAYSDLHVDEDMGGLPRRSSLTAYVAGDLADAQAVALAAVLQAGGPGTLMLPMLGGVIARVETWRLAREKRRAGYVAFEIDFVIGGLAMSIFARVPAAPRLMALMQAGAEIVGLAAAWRLQHVPAGRGAAHAVAAVRAAAVIGGLVPKAGMDAARGAIVAERAKEIGRLADDPVVNASAIAGGLILAAGEIGEFGAADAVADAGVTALTGQAGALPFDIALRAGLAGAFCQALSRRDYSARQDARRAREKISPAVDPVLGSLEAGLDADSHGWLTDVAAITAQDLSDTAADRAPLVRVETGISMPATALAYALYGDADRAEELAARNSVATPAMMPVSFEALSR